MIDAQSVYAQIGAPPSEHPKVDYQLGFKWGVRDAQLKCGPHCNSTNVYIWHSPNGFINQTKEFIDGYVTGFCKITGPNSEMDEPEADFDCNKGPSSAGWMIGHTITGTYTSKFNQTGPNASNTMPPGSKANDGSDVSGFPLLPLGQHYDVCEEDIHHELGYDIVNATGGGV